MVAPAYAAHKMTSDEFLALADHDTGFVELIEGAVYVIAGGASSYHQSLVWRLSLLLGNLVKDGTWFNAPLTVELDEHNAPEPDIFWLAPGSTARIERAKVVGAPDLIIEILSRSTGFRDRTDKYAVYERTGVKEYWLADPVNATLEVYTLRDGKYHQFGVYTEGSTFTSPVLDKELTLTAVFTVSTEE